MHGILVDIEVASQYNDIVVIEGMGKLKFDNVFFTNGTTYAGTSTMVKLLAEKHDGIACKENYHDALLPGLGSKEFPA